MYARYCELRDRKNLKDADVAKACGITPSTFSDWKKGKSAPNADKLRKISAFLDVSMEYLISGKDPEDADALLFTKMKRDSVFWNYAKLTYFLPPAYQEKIYEYIGMISDKANREKEAVSA